jgi:hypothetical protein
MDGFIRTAAYILAALCLILVAGGVSLAAGIRKNGGISPEKLREFVLTEEEKDWLSKMKTMPEEPADKKPEAPAHATSSGPAPVSEQELLTRIAERANADRATKVIEELRRSRDALDERQAWLDQQTAELALARNDLQRLRRSLEAKETELKEQAKRMEAEHARWAAAQVENAKSVTAMNEAEKGRYREQAKLYEAMKDTAWQSLKRMEPKEVARYLALMEQKKAAKLLALAEADQKNLSEGYITRIHQELLTLDPDGRSGSQVARLANLYAFMRGEQVVQYLKGSTPEEVADVLLALGTNVKKRAEILTALRTADADRATEVERLLARRQPTGGA